MGIGINLWLIHLHFIPREPRHPRRNARTSTRTCRNVHKYRQNLPSSLLLISSGSLFALLPRDGSNPISSSTPPRPPLARSTCSIEIPIAALSKALYDEGLQATRALSYGPHDISRLLSYFRYSQSILYHEVKLLLMKKKKIVECYTYDRSENFPRSKQLCALLRAKLECDFYHEHCCNIHTYVVVKDAKGWERFEIGRTCFGLFTVR